MRVMTGVDSAIRFFLGLNLLMSNTKLPHMFVKITGVLCAVSARSNFR